MQQSYKHFPAVGALSHRFSIAPSGETTDRIKKVRACKNGTDLLYHHAKYGGDHGWRADSRRSGKCDVFVRYRYRPAHSATMPVLFLLPVPNFTFIGAEMWEHSPQNCQNFEFWP